MCMSVFLYECMCTTCILGIHRVQKRTSGIGVIDGFELLCGCWESNPDSSILDYQTLVLDAHQHAWLPTAAVMTKKYRDLIRVCGSGSI